MIQAAVITVSDSCFLGNRLDLSGPAVAEVLEANAFRVIGRILVPDEAVAIQKALREQCQVARLVVTTGGTGISPRDVTPEATQVVCDRVIAGFSELMRAEGRKQTPFADLSRAISGTRGASLIVNLPGSPRGAKQSLEAVLALIPHALAMLDGDGAQHDEVEPIERLPQGRRRSE